MLLAVSGGPDSTVLLGLSAGVAEACGLRFAVGHVDHSLRPESAEEAGAVASLARRYGLPFFSARVQVGHAPGIEARARAVRYEALERLRRDARADWVVTAHTLDDQAETVLLRLGRGAALRGLGAIRARAGRVLRPMLGVRREQVRQWLAEAGLPAFTDPMNADPRFARVRVRQELLPAVEKVLGAHATVHLAELAAFADEDDAWLQAAASAHLERLRRGDALDGAGLCALEPPIARRVVVQLLESHGLSASAQTVRQALDAIARGASAPLPKRRELRCASGVVRIVSPRTSQRAGAAWTLSLESPVVDEPASGLRFTLSSEKSAGDVLAVDPARLPLTIRGRLPGDRAGHRKLQDLLVDAKVPRERRSELSLVCAADGEVLWVVGLWKAPAPPGRAVYVRAS